jgi:hypothetical protein
LGIWIKTQRKIKDALSSDQINRLNQLGFSWDPFAEAWEANFNALKKFHKREGHCLIPIGKKEDGLNLGNWVGTQRVNKEQLASDQLKRLNSLGFSWTARTDLWQRNFAALQKFLCFPGSDGHALGVLWFS